MFTVLDANNHLLQYRITMTMITDDDAKALTGRCYCGAISFVVSKQPHSVVYCHCDSCKRATGGPVAAFASLDETAVTFSPNDGTAVSINSGVTRTFCPGCGSSLTGRYDYISGKVFIALGVIDQASELVPTLHCHEAERLSWLSINDELERIDTSARATLNDSVR